MLPVHATLASAVRWAKPAVGAAPRALPADLAWLIAMGALAAAASTLIDLRLRMPGHAILKALLPMSFGLAMAPRHFSGFIMGASAAATGALLVALGLGDVGLGASTSLLLLGPALDLALRWANRGWLLYAGFAAAGLLTNLAALAVKYLGKSGGGGGGGRSLTDWWAQAWFTYPAFGLLAGLLCAAVWFRFSHRGPSQDGSP